MKYYDEVKMADIRKSLDAEVLKWPGVVTRGMMGCLCYFRGRKFFAVLVTNGIAITRLGDKDRSKVAKMKGSKPFEIGGRPSSHWTQQRLSRPRDVTALMPYIRKSYDAASGR